MVLLFQFSPADEENCRKEKLLSKIAVTGYSFWDRFIYTNLHELLCQFISWTNWVNSGELLSTMSSYDWYVKSLRRPHN